jgi:phospholipase C
VTGRLLALAALFALALSAAPLVAEAESLPPTGDGPATTTPIRHFVYLMQESHSFDEYFGTYPGADGIPAGVCLPRDLTNPSAGCIEPLLRGDRAAVEVRHVPGLFEAQADGGRMDGFASAVRDQPGAAESVMSHYDGDTLGWYWNAADRFVLFDRFFSSSTSGHVANHMYWMTGSRGATSSQDAVPEAGWGDGTMTVFDELQAAGVPWKVYVGGYADALAAEAPMSASEVARVPLLGMPRFRNDPELSSRIVDLSQYYVDAQTDALPAVAFIVPSGATSERAPADVDAGQTMVRSLVNELMRSTAWSSSAFLVSYDTGGGSYDHVAPPSGGEPFGPRVPALLVSPYAPTGRVVDTPLDAGSALTFIADNWGLPRLGDGTRGSTSLATALDLASPPRAPELVPATYAPPAPRPVSTASLYPAYGLALLVPATVAGATAWRARRRRRLT